MALKKFSLTVNGALVSGTNANFPAYLNLAVMPASFWATVTSTGGDIRCYSDSALTTQLPREVYACDTTGKTGEVHIKVTSLTTSSIVYLTVDGTSTEPAAGSSFGRNATWTSYVAVQHLGASFTDSTGNGNNGTNTGTTAVTGLTGSARHVDGTSSQFVDFGAAWNDNAGVFTLSVLINFDDFTTGANGNEILVAQKREGGAGDGTWQLGYRNVSASPFPSAVNLAAIGNTGSFGSKISNAASLATGTWYVLNMFVNFITGSVSAIDKNGVSLGLAADGTFASVGTNASTTRLGWSSNSTASFKGIADELRMFAGLKNANWLTTESNNLLNGSTFWTVTDLSNNSGFFFAAAAQ